MALKNVKLRRDPSFARIDRGEFQAYCQHPTHQGNNSINIKNGYRQLKIRSPRDFGDYENNEQTV
jgi:hypothetical protein